MALGRGQRQLVQIGALGKLVFGLLGWETNCSPCHPKNNRVIGCHPERSEGPAVAFPLYQGTASQLAEKLSKRIVLYQGASGEPTQRAASSSRHEGAGSPVDDNGSEDADDEEDEKPSTEQLLTTLRELKSAHRALEMGDMRPVARLLGVGG